MSTTEGQQGRDDLGNMVRGLLRKSGQRADRSTEMTHRSVDVIAHQLRLTSVERFLLWLSKTDIYAMAHCTHHTRLTLSGLGLMVLFTSMLAMLSGYTTLSLVIDPEIELKGFIALVGASIYAFGIMIMDREIVGNPSNRAMWLRLLFAVIIATAVSYPIKLKLLDGPIKAEISSMIEERNIDKMKRIDELQKAAALQNGEQIKEKTKSLESIRKTMSDLQSEIVDEQKDKKRGAVCGDRCNRAKEQFKSWQIQEEKAVVALNKLRSDDSMPEAAKAEIKRFQAEIDKQKSEAFDFLSYWQAQDRVMKKDKSGAKVLSYFLFAFFFALELVPVGLKHSLGTSEYHQYLEARHRLNLQKITSVTNMMLAHIQNAQDLEDILEMPPELSDILAYLMEDGALPEDLEPHLLAILSKTASTGKQQQSDGAPDVGTATGTPGNHPPGTAS